MKIKVVRLGPNFFYSSLYSMYCAYSSEDRDKLESVLRIHARDIIDLDLFFVEDKPSPSTQPQIQ
jgi:hypothetical protein